MSISEYKCSLNNKRRLFIPTECRNKLGSTFIITRGLDASNQYLSLLSKEEWDCLTAKFHTLSYLIKINRAIIRFYVAGAAELNIDSQGRVLIPERLVKYGKLEKDCVVVERNERIELWSKEVWNDFCMANSIDLQEKEEGKRPCM